MTDLDKLLLTNALRMADDHRKHCTCECRISLSLLADLLTKAGIEIPAAQRERFI